MQIILQVNPLSSKPLSDIHLRNGVWGDVPNQYWFNNVSDDIGFITEFPWEQLNNEVDEESLKDFSIEYWIFTSVEDAELAMVERLDMSSLLLYNTIDYPFPQGQIGDNCWYQLSAGVIKFLRNNIYVSVRPKDNNFIPDANTLEWLARKVDTLIVEYKKVYDATLIPAPEIQSMEILSSLPVNREGTVDIKVNAIDEKHQQLYFRKYATGFGIVSETGNLRISFNKNTDLVEDSTKARVKIWVWNEDNIVASTECDIPF